MHIRQKIFIYVAYILCFCLINAQIMASRIQYGEVTDSTTLDPITSSNMVSRRLCEIIYSGLLDFDEDYNPIWRLALEEPSVRNQVEYTYELRDAFWHDGQKVKPEDIIFTYNALKSSSKKQMVDFILDVRKKSESSVEFVLKRPMLNVNGRLAFKMIPRHIAQKVPILRDNPIIARPIGSGPYMFVRKDLNGNVYLKKFDKYFDSKPNQIDEVEMKTYTNEESLYSGLKYGGINVAVSLRAIDVYDIKHGISESFKEPLDALPYNSLSFDFFALNLDPKRTAVGTRFLRGDGNVNNGIKVRQALNYGTNRQAWITRILFDGATPTSGPFATGSPYYNSDVPIYIYDPDKANQLLDEAGYSARDNQGYRMNSKGETIILKLVQRQNAPKENQICTQLISDLKKIGIKVDDTPHLDSETWKTEVYNKHNFDIAFDTKYFGNAGEIYSLFHSSQSFPGGDNYISYSNPYIDALLVKTQNTLDPQGLQSINKILHEKINTECPYIFLWSPINYAGRIARIKNFKVEPFAFFTYITEWELEE